MHKVYFDEVAIGCHPAELTYDIQTTYSSVPEAVQEQKCINHPLDHEGQKKLLNKYLKNYITRRYLYLLYILG